MIEADWHFASYITDDVSDLLTSEATRLSQGLPAICGLRQPSYARLQSLRPVSVLTGKTHLCEYPTCHSQHR